MYVEPISFSARTKLLILQIRHEVSVTVHEISISQKNVRLLNGLHGDKSFDAMAIKRSSLDKRSSIRRRPPESPL